jgi:hypothetical protein
MSIAEMELKASLLKKQCQRMVDSMHLSAAVVLLESEDEGVANALPSVDTPRHVRRHHCLHSHAPFL